MVSQHGGLAIAELIFYIPGLIVAAFAAKKHGFGRSSGWFFLIILAIARIIGASCELASESNPSVSLITASIILQSVGLSPLLLAQLGIMKRVVEGMHKRVVPPMLFNLWAIVPLAGLIVSIIGGLNVNSTKSQQDFENGVKYSKIAACLYLVTLLIALVVILLTIFHVRQIIPGDRKLFYAVVISLPFLLIRCIYSMLVAFNIDHPDSIFSYKHSNIWTQAFMSVLEEFIVVALYLVAGILTPKIKRFQRFRHDNDAEGQGFNLGFSKQTKQNVESGVVEAGH